MPIGVERRMGGNSGSITANPVATVTAPPSPCTSLPTINHSMPGAVAQMSEPSANTATPGK